MYYNIRHTKLLTLEPRQANYTSWFLTGWPVVRTRKFDKNKPLRACQPLCIGQGPASESLDRNLENFTIELDCRQS